MYTKDNLFQLVSKINLASEPILLAKQKQLDELIEANKHLPEQGSPEWEDLRRFNIGGSEMAAVVGESSFSNLKKLVASKAGLTKFRGCTATRWGKLMETATTLFAENVLDVCGRIQETSSLEGIIPDQRYSPDGLAVVKFLCRKKIGGRNIEQYEYLTVLFEFKAPLSSIPRGSIPKHYLPQVLSGLCSIPIADIAIFINNMYRKCPLHYLDDTPRYDRFFHSKDGPGRSCEPLALGIVIFYVAEENKNLFNAGKYTEPCDTGSESDSDSGNIPETSWHDDSSLDDHIRNILESGGELKDFGKSSSREFDELLVLFDKKMVLSHHYSPMLIQKNIDTLNFLNRPHAKQNLARDIAEYKMNIEKFSREHEQKGCVAFGYMPYKIIKSDIIAQNKIHGYVHQHAEKIRDVIKTIRYIMEADRDVEQIRSRFWEKFPHKNDWIDREIENSIGSDSGDRSYDDMIPTI